MNEQERGLVELANEGIADASLEELQRRAFEKLVAREVATTIVAELQTKRWFLWLATIVAFGSCWTCGMSTGAALAVFF